MEATKHAKKSTVFDLAHLLDAGDGALVVLEAGDTRLAAHRAVLVDRSPVFAAMFAHDMQEASIGVVTIPDVEGPVLRHLLAYLYTLQAPELPGVAPQLLAAADKYGVLALKEACEQQVAAQLSVETAAAAAALALRHSCSSLKDTAIAYIKSHGFEVMATQGWADAVRTQAEDVVQLSRLLSESSAPPPADSGTCPPPSGHSQTPPTAASRHTPPPEDAAVSCLQSLRPEEKDRRLIKAAKEGAVGELEALLVAGADAGAADRGMNTALHWAAARGHEEAVRLLLAAGADHGAREGMWQGTPLHWAADGGDAAVVRLLLAAGADHGAEDVEGWTPLHWAVLWGQTEAAAALLEGGASAGARDARLRTPLELARQRNHRPLVDLLQSL